MEPDVVTKVDTTKIKKIDDFNFGHRQFLKATFIAVYRKQTSPFRTEEKIITGVFEMRH